MACSLSACCDLFNSLPPLARPGTRDGVLNCGHAQRLGKSRPCLLALDDRFEKLKRLDRLEIFIAHAVSRPWVKRRVPRMGRTGLDQNRSIVFVFAIRQEKR